MCLLCACCVGPPLAKDSEDTTTTALPSLPLHTHTASLVPLSRAKGSEDTTTTVVHHGASFFSPCTHSHRCSLVPLSRATLSCNSLVQLRPSRLHACCRGGVVEAVSDRRGLQGGQGGRTVRTVTVYSLGTFSLFLSLCPYSCLLRSSPVLSCPSSPATCTKQCCLQPIG